jgi:membrane protease YdiL (CAAX protease family)
MRFVMFAFLSSGIVNALIVLLQNVSSTSDVTRFPRIVSSQVLNMFLGMVAYTPTLALVPLALLLLTRTGQSPVTLGIGVPSWKEDIVPALGIAGAAFGGVIVLAIPFASVLTGHSHLFTTVSVNGFPKYYVVEAIFMSAVTAVTEEVLVNAYFLTRLEQLGWSSRAALLVSLAFRTSYHVYYGVGFIFTIPLGYFVTRSFQKNRRLNRAMWAHFLYDAILLTITILH